MAMVLVSACTDRPHPVVPTSRPTGPLLTASDSADYLAWRRSVGTPLAPGFALTGEAVAVTVAAGDEVSVSVVGLDNGRCEDVYVSGAITAPVFSGIGLPAVCAKPAGPIDIGPAESAGVLTFTIASGGTSQITVNGPGVYTVAFEDASDGDYNDVVLSVTIGGGEPKLECSPQRLERGQEVRCRTSGSGVTVQGWSFRGRGARVQSASTESEWKGIAVVGGAVTANVTIDGRRTELNSSFAVTDRAWMWGPNEWSFADGAAPLPSDGIGADEPVVGYRLGWNCTLAGCGTLRRVQPDVSVTSDRGYQVAPVAGGPNDGQWYVTGASFRMDRASGINPQVVSPGVTVALPEGSQARECRARMGVAPTAAVELNFYTFNTVCKQVNLAPLAAGIRAHEAWGTNGGNGHESAGQRSAASNDPYRAIEDDVAGSEATLRQRVVRQVGRLQTEVNNDGGDHRVVRGNFSVDVWLWNGRDAYVRTPLNDNNGY